MERQRKTGEPRENPPSIGIVRYDSYVLEYRDGPARNLTRVRQVRFPAVSLPYFRRRESCRTVPLVGGFSRGCPVSPDLSFQRCSIPTSLLHPYQLVGEKRGCSCLAAVCSGGAFPRRVARGTGGEKNCEVWSGERGGQGLPFFVSRNEEQRRESAPCTKTPSGVMGPWYPGKGHLSAMRTSCQTSFVLLFLLAAAALCLAAGPGSYQGQRSKTRSIRGFKNVALSTARGFGKRDGGADLVLDQDKTDRLVVDRGEALGASGVVLDRGRLGWVRAVRTKVTPTSVMRGEGVSQGNPQDRATFTNAHCKLEPFKSSTVAPIILRRLMNHFDALSVSSSRRIRCTKRDPITLYSISDQHLEGCDIHSGWIHWLDTIKFNEWTGNVIVKPRHIAPCPAQYYVDKRSLPVDWFVEELRTNPELARIIVHKFVDLDQDGELSAEELLRPVY
ncbi:hypothetical protein PR048_022555 [Dryococelus australis]|nr:hypothetical protein PR048_022555 [Dryococelus australis]